MTIILGDKVEGTFCLTIPAPGTMRLLNLIDLFYILTYFIPVDISAS